MFFCPVCAHFPSPIHLRCRCSRLRVYLQGPNGPRLMFYPNDTKPWEWASLCPATGKLWWDSPKGRREIPYARAEEFMKRIVDAAVVSHVIGS